MVPKLYVGFELTPKRDVRCREFHSVGANFFLCHNRHKLLLIFRGETNKFAIFKRSLVRFGFFQKLLNFVLMANLNKKKERDCRTNRVVLTSC